MNTYFHSDNNNNYVSHGPHVKDLVLNAIDKNKLAVEIAQKSEALLVGSYRLAGDKFLEFIQLYKSIENANRNIFFYRYAISTKTVHRLEIKISTIMKTLENKHKNYYDDTCNGVQLKHVFHNNSKSALSKGFIKITEEVSANKEILSTYDNNFMLAHLVPNMHLLFDGHESLRGNCSVVAVWETTYKYLLDVDKALINYVKEENKNVYISAGYSLKNRKTGVVLPNLIWKRVIVYALVNDEERLIDKDNSFAVIISNDMVFDEETNASKLRKLNYPCDQSCKNVKLNVEDDGEENIKEHKKLRIINCCKITEEVWETFELLNLINLPPRN